MTHQATGAQTVIDRRIGDCMSFQESEGSTIEAPCTRDAW